MSTNARRPFGVSFLSILLIIGGILEVVGGIFLLVQRNDDDILNAVDVSSSDVTTYGVVSIVLGVIVVLIGYALRSGANWSRLLVGVIAAVRVATLVWAVVAYHQIHWYNVMWPAIIYTLAAGYLFFDDDAKAYFERT